MLGRDLIMQTLLGGGSSGGGSSSGGGGSSGGGIEGYTTLQGTFTAAEDITSGYHTIMTTENGSVPTAPQEMFSFVYLIGGWPDGSTTKHLVSAAGVTMYQYDEFIDAGVRLYSSGNGSNPTATATNNSKLVYYDSGWKRLEISVYTSGSPILAGTTYGWLFFYK